MFVVKEYSAQYMEAIFDPGMTAPAHADVYKYGGLGTSYSD